MHARVQGANGRSAWIVALLTVVLVAGCGSTTVTNTSGPSASLAPTPSITAASPAPSATSADPFLGQAVVTVSPDLRVRSQPRVADDSAKYEPLLPTGTELTVIGGPVSASGYTWYEVIPVDVRLVGGHGSGWVAAGDKDGTPWIALRTATAPTADLVISSVKRAAADPAKAKAAAASINSFGLDLYRALFSAGTLQKDEGAVISPASIVLALAMTLPGAEGETATQLEKVLHTTDWQALGPGLNALTQSLAGQDATWTDFNGTAHKLALRIANAAFAQRGEQPSQSYLDELARVLGVGLRLVDYVADPEAARQTINGWVADRTEQRIKELLKQGVVSTYTRLVLVNAIYLKAAWARLDQQFAFSEESTKPARFTRLDGSFTDVPTMTAFGGQTLPYVRGTGWEATELLYEGKDGSKPLAMTLIKPSDLAAFESRLTPSQLDRIVGALDGQRTALGVVTHGNPNQYGMDCGTYPYAVDLFLPRFGLETAASLKDALRALSLDDPTDPAAADFSGMTSKRDLYIADVIHQANIDVDEKGTEAAAATAVVMDTTGGCGGPDPAKTITLRLDHPFLFVLRDVASGAVLFVGRVVDPSVRS